jgi:hypothetical protein
MKKTTINPDTLFDSSQHGFSQVVVSNKSTARFLLRSSAD